MIRANLLPQPGGYLAIFGLRFETALVRQSFSVLASVALAAVCGSGLELWRAQRLDGETTRLVALAHANDERRTALHRVALELAHLQDVRSSATELRNSGNAVALQIARVGNAIPAGVWLDRLTLSAQLFELGGETSTLEGAGATAARLERDVPRAKAILTGLRRREDGHYAFAAQLDVPK